MMSHTHILAYTLMFLFGLVFNTETAFLFKSERCSTYVCQGGRATDAKKIK